MNLQEYTTRSHSIPTKSINLGIKREGHQEKIAHFSKGETKLSKDYPPQEGALQVYQRERYR